MWVEIKNVFVERAQYKERMIFAAFKNTMETGKGEHFVFMLCCRGLVV